MSLLLQVKEEHGAIRTCNTADFNFIFKHANAETMGISHSITPSHSGKSNINFNQLIHTNLDSVA